MARLSISQRKHPRLTQQHGAQGVSVSALLAVGVQQTVLGVLNPQHSLESLAYLPFGFRPALPTTLGFNGQPADYVTGHYPLGNGNRIFVTSMMRFSSPDSMSPFGEGGMNSYAYCLGDPVNRLDPSGSFSLRQFFRWLFPKKEKKSPARVFKELSNNDPDIPINIVGYSERIPKGYELIGLHGSDKVNTESLESGLDLSQARASSYGQGFYMTTQISAANNYAGQNGLIFGVYTKKPDRLRDKRYYSRLGGNNTLIRAGAYKDVIIRDVVINRLLIVETSFDDYF